MAGHTAAGPYTSGMAKRTRRWPRVCVCAVVTGVVLATAGCGGSEDAGHPAAAPPAATAADRASGAGGDVPDTGDMGAFVLAKINANPGIAGKATLAEFRQKSVATQPLGDKMRSAVVEFEGVVTFSSDVSWSWQGPTQAGAPQRFEARAEYVDQGQGWQLVEPVGIYPL
jgi:hypothetical protein